MTIALAAATPAAAQTSPMPPDIAAKLIEIGRVVDPEKTAPLYAPLQEKEPYSGIKVTRDIRYGAAERNLLDVFVPEGAGGARPVLIFVHGGGFVRGNKRAPGSPFYDNIMLWAARNGMVGVNMTYRLAPQSPWPAGAEDVGAGSALGRGQHCKPWRRPGAHLSHGPFRRRHPCRELRRVPAISWTEGARPCRSHHDLRLLRSDAGAVVRSAE